MLPGHCRQFPTRVRVHFDRTNNFNLSIKGSSEVTLTAGGPHNWYSVCISAINRFGILWCYNSVYLGEEKAIYGARPVLLK